VNEVVQIACAGTRGSDMLLSWCCCMCGLPSCSLECCGVSAAGAVAIGAALAHLPQLQTLEYVVCSAVCAGSWCTLQWARGALACACAVLLCVRFVPVQPSQQPYRCRGCGSYRSRPGPPAPAADTGVRCVPGCVCEFRVCVCTGTRGHGMRLRCAAVCAACVRAALHSTMSVPRVRRPLVQAWSTCPSCRHWSTLCARLCAQGHSVCSQGIAGPWHAPALCCCVCGLCWCSLRGNDIGGAGAAAIGAGLVYVPQLQTLEYVVCLAVCAGWWCVLAWICGSMACVCA